MRNTAKVIRAAMALAIAALGSTAAQAATATPTEIQIRYEQERAACLSGRTGQDQATCLREAGAARDAARHGQLDNGNGQLHANALARCAPLKGDDEMACEARMAGMGTVSGSVQGGGVLREIVIRKVGPLQPIEPPPPPPQEMPQPPAMPPR